MKKNSTPQHGLPRSSEKRTQYYKEVGENAAMCIFTKKKLGGKRLTSLSPKIKRLSHHIDSTPSEKDMKILRDIQSRDISHLRDRVGSPLQNLTGLPSDIETVKKLVQHSDKHGNPTLQGSPLPISCRKNLCLDEIYKSPNYLTAEAFSIDKILLGSPSGRQECENLKKWLENMKNLHCSTDIFSENGRVIYSMCCKELIRQVSVNCLERGELLQEIIDYYTKLQMKMQGNIKSAYSNYEQMIKEYTDKYLDKEKEYLDEINEIRDTNEKLKIQLKKTNERIAENEKIIKRHEITIEDMKYKLSEEDYGFKNKGFLKRAVSGLPKDSMYSNKSKAAERGDSKIVSKGTDWDNNESLLSKWTQTGSKELKVEANVVDFTVFPLNHEYMDPGILIEINDADLIQDKNEYFTNEGLLGLDDLEKSKNTKSEMLSRDEKGFHLSPPMLLRQDTRSGKIKKKKNQKKDLGIKVSEIDKKIQEKQSELDAVIKKIKVKYVELDFLSKTVDYKKLRDAFFKRGITSGTNITYDKILMKKPSLRKEFNILADSNFWSEDHRDFSHRVKQINRSSTQNFDDSSITSRDPNTPTSPKTPKAPKILAPILKEVDDELESEDSIENSQDISHPSAYLDLSTDQLESFEDKHFSSIFKKKSVIPLYNLVSTLDLNLISMRKHQKKTPAIKILNKISAKDLKWIISKATLSRKLIHKIIVTMYGSYFSHQDLSENFIDFIYFDFYQRYGLKFVSDKKFVEFICSCIRSDDSKKCTNFLRFVSMGHKVGKKNFSHKGFELYLESLTFLTNSKIGIANTEDYYEKFLVPVARASECIREQLEKFDKSQILRIISLAESKAVADPKKISIGGLIECENVLEWIIEAYESLPNKYIEGVEFLINSLKYNEPKDSLLKSEILMVFRAIIPENYEDFEKHYDDFNIITLEDFCLYSVTNSIFAMTDLTKFYSESKSKEEIYDMIKSSLSEMHTIVGEIESTDKFMKTLPQEIWELKLKNLEKALDERDAGENIFAFKVFYLELHRVRSTFL